MPEHTRIRCSSCRQLVSTSMVWAIHDICPSCLQPLREKAAGAGGTGSAGVREITSRWVDSFNARDLDGMLACMDAYVDFHPLRFFGLDSACSGHDGVRDWFLQLEELEHEHRIDLSEIRDAGEDQAIAVGVLGLTARGEAAPFWALHRVAGGSMVAAYQYFTHPDLMDYLGPSTKAR